MYNDTLRKTFTNVHFFGGVGKDNLLVMYIFGERPGSKLKRAPIVYFSTVFEFYDILYFIKKKVKRGLPWWSSG